MRVYAVMVAAVAAAWAGGAGAHQPGDDVAEAADTKPAGPRFILA
jgi:hypothetical protein